MTVTRKQKKERKTSNKQAKSHTRNLRHKITRNWEEKQLYGYFNQQTSEISHEKS